MGQVTALAMLVSAVFIATAAGGQTTRWCDRLPRPQYAKLERAPVSDDWFQVYRVRDGVFAIYEPYQWQEVISYLILGKERALLFDTGMGISRISAVVRELTTLPVVVLNSHTHFDHIGGNAEFAHILAMNTEFTRKNAAGYPPERYKEEVTPEALCRPLPPGVTAASYRIKPFTPERYLEDGATIDLGQRTLRVIAVPGHTPDAIALLDEKAGLLWTGDTFYEGPIWLFVPETDFAAYASSVDRLAALAPSITALLPSHNTPLAAPHRLIELRNAVAALREGRVKPTEKPGDQLEFMFDGFSILTSRAVLAGLK